MTDWKKLKAELLADTETQAAYDAVRPRYQLASLLITLRRVTGLSQAAVAKRAGMTQPEISRIEAAEVQPTWGTIQRLLSAFDAEVEVKVRAADGELARVALEQLRRPLVADSLSVEPVLAPPAGVEPTTPWSEARCSIH